MFDFLFHQEDVPSKGNQAGGLKAGYAIAALILVFLGGIPGRVRAIASIVSCNAQRLDVQ